MEISNASQIWTNKVHILGSFLEFLITTVKNSTKKTGHKFMKTDIGKIVGIENDQAIKPLGMFS